MSASEAFRLRETPGQRRHDRVFAIGSHQYLRLSSWRDIRPNDLLFHSAGDSVTGEVSHLGYLMGPQVFTGSGTINGSDTWTPAVARPNRVTFARNRFNGLLYASGQEWNDPVWAVSEDFRAGEWRYVRAEDPWYSFGAICAPGECVICRRSDLP
jgi:hypothetical protein